MKHPELNKYQRNAIIRIIRHYRKHNQHNGVTSIRIKLDIESSRLVFVSVDTRRSDCHKYSPRAVACGQSAFIRVGRRGGIDVIYATNGTRSDKSYRQGAI